MTARLLANENFPAPSVAHLRERGHDVLAKLRLAQAATVVTLLLLAAAVGLTWYGPRSTSVTLEVERKSLPNVCGKLASSADGYMDIEPSASAPVPYAYRFALCHEMAHVALEHVDASRSELRAVGSEDYEALLASQQQELEADRFRLELQIKSIPDSTQLVTALASAVYFVHITGLLDARLMLLAHLVDYESWNIAYTHPPALERVFDLMGGGTSWRLGRGVQGRP
ncbi:MAG: hypothetical protein ACREXW_07535 [Gammaproteobacteria bacterium]